MTARRSPWALVLWPAGLIGVLFAVWIAGYLYWQIRIGRAVADLQQVPAKYFVTPYYRNDELIQIGSRGFRRLLVELDGALARGDVDQAAAFYWGFADLLQGSWGDFGKAPLYDALREKPSPARMRADRDAFVSSWSHSPEDYAPWWMWWTGTRRLK